MFLFQYFQKPLFLDNLYTPLDNDSLFVYLFKYNLPYGFWCLSGLLLIRAVWLRDVNWRAVYGAVFIIIVMSYVLLKLPGITPGTFDGLDIVVMALFAFLESVIFNVFVRRNIV